MTLAAGDYFPGAKIRHVKQGTTTAIAKGLVTRWDQTNDGYTVESADASILGPFAVCVIASSAGATQFTACVKGEVAVTADGTIEPYDLVQMSSSTDGQVITFATATVDGAGTDVIKAVRDNDARIVGQYIGKEGTGDGVIVADASDGDVIMIDLFEGK